MTTTQPTPPPSDESTAQSITTDAQGIGPPPQPQRALEPLHLVTRLFGADPPILAWADASLGHFAHGGHRWIPPEQPTKLLTSYDWDEG